MADRYEIRTEAERFIHNDLSNCASDFNRRTNGMIEAGETAGIYHNMLAALVFTAFSIEAKINFVGWSVLKNGWPERASLTEKIELLGEILHLKLTWGERPLQTIKELKRFRDVLAHGKPEIVDETIVTSTPGEVWDALKGRWEANVTPQFVNRCIEDEERFWQILLERAGISVGDTFTRGGHSLRKLVERN